MSKTRQQIWDDFWNEVDSFTSRAERINEMAHQRAVKDLRQLHPELPVQSCLHLAHNWLVCGDDRHKARKAEFIINRMHQVWSRTYELRKQWYSRLYQEIQQTWK